jgi:type III restriction enzyme
MSDFEVPEAIICSPFEEPAYYWRLQEGAPEKRSGRRPAIYYYPDPISQDSAGTVVPKGTAIELKLVSRFDPG